MELLQVQSEIDPVIKIYRKHKPKRVLEIGSWDGGTLKLWIENADAGTTIVAVDMEHRNAAAYTEWQRSEVKLVTFTGDSHSPDMHEAIRSCAPYDWVFVDGDHSDYGVRADVAITKPLIRENGVLVLHDITPSVHQDTYPPGVLCDELEKQGYRVERFEDPKREGWSHGLGVIYL